MKFTLLSLVAGNEICNARCPFCVSKMTPTQGVDKKKPVTDWRNFRKAAQLARTGGAQTVLITGKGEPTLFPEHINEYLQALEPYGFEFVELQTNGILIAEKPHVMRNLLELWYDLGLTTIAISMVHYDAARNREIYTPHRKAYIDLENLIDVLHKAHFTVRLATVLLDGYIDSAQSFGNLIDFARRNGVEQLSARPVSKPDDSRDVVAEQWTAAHMLKEAQLEDIRQSVVSQGALLQKLPHGAEIYDVGGQNVCLTNCLTKSAGAEETRQLIFFPNGNISYDWQYEGALLLRGRYTEEPASLEGAKQRESRLYVLPSRSSHA